MDMLLYPLLYPLEPRVCEQRCDRIQDTLLCVGERSLYIYIYIYTHTHINIRAPCLRAAL